MLRRVGYPTPHWSKQSGLTARKFFVIARRLVGIVPDALVNNRLRFCTADRAGRRPPTITAIFSEPRCAGDQAAVLGLLQALKHASPANVAGLTVKLVPIPSGRSVQLIGFIIQFAGHTTHFRVLLVMIKIARCEKPSGDPTIDDSYSRQLRQRAKNLPSMSLTSSGKWSVR